jgi:hypothetical protein
VQAASQKLGEAMYGPSRPRAAPGVAPEAQSDRGTAGAGRGGDGKKKDDDVIDAEFEVK